MQKLFEITANALSISGNLKPKEEKNKPVYLSFVDCRYRRMQMIYLSWFYFGHDGNIEHSFREMGFKCGYNFELYPIPIFGRKYLISLSFVESSSSNQIWFSDCDKKRALSFFCECVSKYYYICTANRVEV